MNTETIQVLGGLALIFGTIFALMVWCSIDNARLIRERDAEGRKRYDEREAERVRTDPEYASRTDDYDLWQAGEMSKDEFYWKHPTLMSKKYKKQLKKKKDHLNKLRWTEEYNNKEEGVDIFS